MSVCERVHVRVCAHASVIHACVHMCLCAHADTPTESHTLPTHAHSV